MALQSQFTSLQCSTQHYYSIPTTTAQHLLQTSASNVFRAGWCYFSTRNLSVKKEASLADFLAILSAL